MPLKAFRYLISVILFTGLAGMASAQVTHYNFNWNNLHNEKMSGDLSVRLEIPPDGQTYFALLTVTWLDANGAVIEGTSDKPFLYLSRYDIEINPAQAFICTSFNDRKFQLKTQQSGRLAFQAQTGFKGEVTIKLDFQYALSQKDYDEGHLERIQTQLGSTIRLTLTVTDQPNLTKDQQLDVTGNTDRSVTLRPRPSETAIQLQRLAIRLDIMEDRKESESIENQVAELAAQAPGAATLRKANELNSMVSSFLDDLNSYTTDVEVLKSELGQTGITEDTLTGYRNRIEGLLSGASVLRTSYSRYRIQLSSWLSPERSSQDNVLKDSLLRIVREKYKPEMALLCDSIEAVRHNLQQVFDQLRGITVDGKVRRKKAAQADSLLWVQRKLRDQGEQYIIGHNTLWTGYRSDILSLEIIPEIEKIHSDFGQSERSFHLQADSLSLFVSSLDRQPDRDRASTRILGIGFALFAVIMILLLFRAISASRKRNLQKALHPETVSGQGQASRPGSLGIIEEGGQEAFYSVDFRERLPESVIGKLHFSPGSVKSVYQMIHGAFLEKKPGGFGGYLLGSQYRLSGSGKLRYELIIDKAVPSRLLNAEVPDTLETRSDLVEELDEIIKQNRKLLLIGWFSASAEPSLEMQDRFMKIFRNLFQEKWQFGLLINPGSEDLQSALFMRRKSGYVEPYPDPASFLKWEEMYRYALQPSGVAKPESAGQMRNEADYVSLSFSSTWADSAIRSIGFHREVLEEIGQASVIVAVPDDSYQLVGYLYGEAVEADGPDSKPVQYHLYAERFIELANESTPRDIPGYTLLGWWGQGKAEIFSYLTQALTYHEQIYHAPYQVCCLVQVSTGELRIFTRKTDLEMNNNVIETEEFNLSQLL